MAPAGLPPEIAERLTREVKAIYDDPKVNRKMVDMEIILNWADGKTFAPLIQRDMDLWRELVRQSGVTFE
jgi:tripartite-type tricarboxylate transporter receptor subunit TctC